MSWIRTLASKPIKVEITTPFEFLLQYFPPLLAKDATPEWIRKIPHLRKKEAEEVADKARFRRADSTIRMCDGINELFRQGLILPAWTDVRIVLTAEEEMVVSLASTDFNFEHHPVNQHAPILQNFRNLKLVSPWHIKCAEDIKWVWLSALYHNQFEAEGIITPQAVVSYQYQCGSNVNLMIPFSTEREFEMEITAGTALAQIVPLSSRPIELHLRYLPHERWNSESNAPFAWHHYKRRVTFWKARNQSPFDEVR